MTYHSKTLSNVVNRDSTYEQGDVLHYACLLVMEELHTKEGDDHPH
jgi:hypothetical protein